MTPKIAKLARRAAVLAGCGAVLMGAGGALAEEKFETRLAPVAMDMLTRANVAGVGHVTAVLEGTTLAISGSFEGLPSPAIGGELRQGMVTGTRGPVVATVSAARAQSGSVSNNIKLNRVQLAALRAGKMYVQLNSEKAPDGNLWGWLLPVQPVAATAQ
jgi:hypothetical protein